MYLYLFVLPSFNINYCYFQRFCADIISVLGMTFSDNKESLKYRLLGSKEEIGSWGHEYVRLVLTSVSGYPQGCHLTHSMLAYYCESLPALGLQT